jgi:hypothetical protein
VCDPSFKTFLFLLLFSSLFQKPVAALMMKNEATQKQKQGKKHPSAKKMAMNNITVDS